MWYNYFDKNEKVVGWYQCSIEDFKKMWKVVKNEVSSCVVKLDNGDCWLYVKTSRKDRYVGFSGWSRIKEIVTLSSKKDYK